MERQLYHYYDPNDENRVKAGLYSEAPEFVISHVCNGEIDPVYDKENNRIVEHQSVDISEKMNQEIEALRENTKREISKFMYEYNERLSIRQIPIPEDVMRKYDEMRAEFHIKKTEILNKYNL